MEPTGQIISESANPLIHPDKPESRCKPGPAAYNGSGRACRTLALTAVLCLTAAFSHGQSDLQAHLQLLSAKPTLEIAQAPATPTAEPADDTIPDPPAENATDAPAEPAPEDDSEFVFAGDLARTLRKIDPNAKVDWDGKKLQVRVNDQEFAIFPTGEDMVVNGDVQTGLPPLKIRNGEIYVPQQAVSRIGQVLENKLAPATTTIESPTPAVTTATATVTPAVSPTPETSILPDAATPAAGTPTPATEAVPILPDVTPSPATAATPTATPASTPAATPAATPTPQTSVATPFPKATPTPTPKPTPTPTPTPAPSPTPKEGAAEAQRSQVLSAASFKAALQDKISVSTRDIAIFNSTQLDELAANRNVKKIIIHPEEGGLEREDDYGQQAARLSMELAQRVKVQLQDAGFEVEMTRNSEAAVTVGEALQTITRSQAQVLLVISVGYSTNFQDLGGYRLFFMNDSVDYNTLRDRTFDASEAVPSEMNYKPFQDMSKVLASSLRNSIQGVLDRDPVGMNPAPLYFVRRAPMASTAVVTGYLSNPADAKRLTDPAQQDAMAKALVEGIQNYAEQVSQGKTKPAGDL